MVFHKNVGPLISMEEMSRCIHCTCCAFGQEIAGIMELGMANRNMHSEIQTFVVARSIRAVGQHDRPVPGRCADLEAVPLLARSWELQRRKSVSPHDSVGANLIVQVKNNRVMRVLPRENEDVNECWISDKDRFSYEALNSDARLTKLMIRSTASCAGSRMERCARLCLARAEGHRQASMAPANSVSCLAARHPRGNGLKKLAAGLGSKNIDFRLRRRDFSADGSSPAVRGWASGWPRSRISMRRWSVAASCARSSRWLAQRLRQAAKKFTKVSHRFRRR